MLEGVQMSVKSRSAALFLLAAKLYIKPVISSGALSVRPFFCPSVDKINAFHHSLLQALLYLTKNLACV